jgi:hypothetical protein
MLAHWVSVALDGFWNAVLVPHDGRSGSCFDRTLPSLCGLARLIQPVEQDHSIFMNLDSRRWASISQALGSRAPSLAAVGTGVRDTTVSAVHPG